MSSLIMAVALLGLLSIGTVMGQSTSCASKLVPCASYLNSTNTPPSSCCDSVKEVVTKELPCLCTLYETPGLLAQLGINSTQALALAGRCGVPADLSSCNGKHTYIYVYEFLGLCGLDDQCAFEFLG